MSDYPSANQPIPYSGKKDFVFISYSHKDSKKVHPIIDQMVKNEFRVWFDQDLRAGSKYNAVIAEHIEKCGYFIAFMSKNYVNSNYCIDELHYARDINKPFLVVYLDNFELPSEIKLRLARVQNILKYNYKKDCDFFNNLFNAEGIETCKEEQTYFLNEETIHKNFLISRLIKSKSSTSTDKLAQPNSTQSASNESINDWFDEEDTTTLSKTDKDDKPTKKVKASVSAGTYKGSLYEVNEDNYSFNGHTTVSGYLHKECIYSQDDMTEPFHLAISDGEGEDGLGKLASGFAIEAFVAHSSQKYNTISFWDAQYRIEEEVKATGKNLDASISAIVATKGIVHSSSIGDCSVYSYSDGNLKRYEPVYLFSEPHHPEYTLRTIDRHPSTCLHEDVKIGDVFLLCSKGLTNKLNDDEISEIVSSCETSKDTVKKLIKTAIEKGDTDNITVIVAFMDVEDVRDNNE